MNPCRATLVPGASNGALSITPPPPTLLYTPPLHPTFAPLLCTPPAPWNTTKPPGSFTSLFASCLPLPVPCSVYAEYRFDVSKLEPVVAKVRRSLLLLLLSVLVAALSAIVSRCSAQHDALPAAILVSTPHSLTSIARPAILPPMGPSSWVELMGSATSRAHAFLIFHLYALTSAYPSHLHLHQLSHSLSSFLLSLSAPLHPAPLARQPRHCQGGAGHQGGPRIHRLLHWREDGGLPGSCQAVPRSSESHAWILRRPCLSSAVTWLCVQRVSTVISSGSLHGALVVSLRRREEAVSWWTQEIGQDK